MIIHLYGNYNHYDFYPLKSSLGLWHCTLTAGIVPPPANGMYQHYTALAFAMQSIARLSRTWGC